MAASRSSEKTSYVINLWLDRPCISAAIVIAVVMFGAVAGLSGVASAQVPPVTLSLASLSFGNQFVEKTSPAQTVTLTNNQSVALNISSVTTTTDFAQTNNCGSVVAPKASCTISVTFTPSMITTRFGSLTINDNASNSPQQVALNGTAVPTVSLLPSASIAFGSQTTYTTSKPQTVTVVNNQSVALNFTSSIQISGDFQQTNTCGSSIPGKSSCIITVVFHPMALGARTGQIHLIDDASSSGQYIYFTGNGTPGPVILSPASLSFGNQFIKKTSPPQTVTLTNNQGVALNLSSVTTTIDFAQTSNCGSVVAPRASCTISVTFTPSMITTRFGSLTISDNASNSPQQVALGGTGTQPVSLLPSSYRLAFGNQTTYTTSRPQTVTVLNNQSVVLHFSSIQVVGYFQQTNTCGSSIPANSSCTVAVVFRPAALGATTGTLVLTDDVSTSPQYVSLSGNGVAASPTLSILTYHYDNNRTGANTNETILTPANVNQSKFGKLFSIPVDAGILAQPLYVPNLQIPGLGTHNVIYVATQHNSLYAFDADNGATLWAVNLGPYRPLPQGCQEPGDTGIIGTPVIDLSSRTLYVVAATLRGVQPKQELHALDITTGAERPSSPAVITASVAGTGYGTAGGTVTFDPSHQLQRSALLLDNGMLYIAEAVLCDGAFDVPGHGWLFAYNKSTLQQAGFFMTSPNGYGGDIWAGGGGPAADVNHNVYFSTGNGNFDVNQGGSDYGDSLIKLSPSTLSPLDYFTPFDQASLEANDADLGSGGILLLPDQSTLPSHLLVTAGKEGRIYLVNRDKLGKYNPTYDNVVQFEIAIQSLISTPSFWNNTLYFAAWADYPKAFSFLGGRISNNPTSHAATTYSFPGAVTVVSANGQTNGILWALQHGGTASGNEVLHAYDATNLAKELYNSNQAGSRDLPGAVGKEFESIIVVNGKVYVPTGQPQLTVFGLLPGH